MTIKYELDKRGSKLEKQIKMVVDDRTLKAPCKISTSLYIPIEFWDNKNRIAKKKYPHHLGFNGILSKGLDYAKQTEINFKLQSLNFDVWEFITELKRYFNNKGSDFFSIVELYKKALIDRNKSKATQISYNQLFIHLRKFENDTNTTITFQTLNQTFLKSLIAYNQKINNSNNTIKQFVVRLTAFLNWTIKENYNSNIEFRKWDISHLKIKQKQAIALTDIECQKLLKLEFTDSKSDLKLKYARDIFIFAVLTGQREGDVTQLENIQEIDNKKYWLIEQQKTGKDGIKIRLNDLAMSILEHYNYKFDMMSDSLLWSKIKKLVVLADLKRTKSIIDIKTGIAPEPKYINVSMHVARKTFSTILREKGMNADIIEIMTGHATQRILDNNYTDFNKTVYADNANDILQDFLKIA